MNFKDSLTSHKAYVKARERKTRTKTRFLLISKKENCNGKGSDHPQGKRIHKRWSVLWV